MPTKYRREIRDKVRVYLRDRGRVDDARSVGRRTSMERLRLLLSFTSVEDMYNFFDHDPIVTNADGNPDRDPRACYLIFGETSVRITRLESGTALTRHIGLDFVTSWGSISKALRSGGARLKIGKYQFAITRRYTTDISSIPESTNNYFNIRIAAKLEGVPKTCISMHDIAKHRGVGPGRGVVRRLCDHFGIEHHKGRYIAMPRPGRPTTLTNIRTGEVLEFETIVDAAMSLKVHHNDVIRACGRRETITSSGEVYSIFIAPKVN